ncbi:hypothetical protein BKA70DRAFT_1250347 [Coprinopsis sp. MPI-PUGE-AT-0042]|nr:hypothetical protein BKA70DRAFT_1250347 [Coprinopsis sp. MPI-PUGE-AT-0042]
MLLARCSRQCRQSTPQRVLVASAQIHLTASAQAISLTAPPARKEQKERVFKDKKAFQYNWYNRILQTSDTAPLLILHHHDFTAERLKKLRGDIITAAERSKPPSLASPTPAPVSSELPTLTNVRSSIFGVALRNFNVPQDALKQMIKEGNGQWMVLSLPSMHPPLINAVLRAMDRSVPPKPPKTPEEIKAAEDAKHADPDQPGRRMKRVRQTRIPELKLAGAIIEGRVFLPPGLNDVAKLPTLDTLRAQIVGLLSAPGAQIAGVLGQASGGQLARTLEGLKKTLEEGANPKVEGEAPPS